MLIQGKATLLIVDDEDINLEILNAGLSDDYLVVRCSEALEVLPTAEKEQPDLILLDIGMPQMNGYQVCDALKKNDKTKHIPVIFSTALDSAEDEILGFEFGASDYITKPFNMQLLRLRVANLVALKRQTDLLEQMVKLDGLTQIPNRRHFDSTFESEWRRAVRGNTLITVCMLDIDFFKQFNDNYGHAAGDECLIRIASELNGCLKRAGDIVARYGGEEFVILLPEMSSVDALNFAEYLLQKVVALGIKHAHSTCSDVVTTSIGIATAKASNKIKRESLLKQADEQLYLAKRRGKNQAVATELSDTLEE